MTAAVVGRGGGGWPWPGVVPGAGEIGADSEAVAPGDEAEAVEELVAAAVVELAGSGGGGGGGGIGGGEDMVETRVPDTQPPMSQPLRSLPVGKTA